MKRIFFPFLLLTLFINHIGYASYIPKILGVKWRTTETKHFVIHYHEGVDYTVRKLAYIADDTYDIVTKFYDFPLKNKVHITLIDQRDGTNGFAISSLDMINIEATNLYFNNFNLRGRSDWLKNVLTHEFAHIVSLKRATLFGERVSTFNFFPVINETPEDILGKDPNINFYGSMVIPSKVNPYWWIEGTAQFATEKAQFDKFDTHRDMFLRNATLEDNLLTPYQMSVKGALKSPYGELAYCQGFALNRYFASKFGDQFNNKLIDNTAKTYPSWLSAMETTFDENVADIFSNWKKEIEEAYLKVALEKVNSTIDPINDHISEGKMVLLSKDDKIIEKKYFEIDSKTNKPIIKRLTKKEKDERKKSGKYNIYPKLSGNGKWFSFIRDNNLYIKNQENIEYELIVANVTSYDWSSDSNFIVYSTARGSGAKYYDGFEFHDLAVIDLREFYKSNKPKNVINIKKQRKNLQAKFKLLDDNFITKNIRAEEPAWSPDGKRIAFIKNLDGTKKLGIIEVSNGTIDYPTDSQPVDFTEGIQTNSPSWSPDSKKIVFSLFKNNNQELWMWDLENKKGTQLTSTPFDVRDPYWFSDNLIYFSSDENKIFNIYSIELSTAKIEKITNVLGGAFMPFVSKDGKELIYSNFSSFGFKIYSLTLTNDEKQIISSFNKETKEIIEPKYPALSNQEDYSLLHFLPQLKNLIPIQLIPEFYLYGGQAGFGLNTIVEDYLSHHRLQGRFLLDEDQIYSVAYKNSMFYPVFTLSYSKIINKNFISALYSESTLSALGLTSNENPGLYSELLIEFYDAKLEYFVDNDKYEGLRFSAGYNFRGISAKVPAGAMGADVSDVYFNSVGTYDRNGSYGDAESFPILESDSIGAKVGYIKGIDVGSESVALSGDNDINPKGYGIVLNYSYSNSFQDEEISNYGVYGRRNEGEPTSNYNFNVYRVDGTYAIANPIRKKDTIEIRFNASAVDKKVTINDKLFLGGQPLFQTYRDVSNSYQFPGYGGYSISGESRGALSLTYRFPVYTDIWKGAGILFFDDLYVNLFFDVGNVWDYGEIFNSKQDEYVNSQFVSHAPSMLFDTGITIKSKAFVYYQYPWHSFLTVAHGFQDKAKYGFSDADWPVRIYLGLGLSL